jgi:hypothetical protein
MLRPYQTRIASESDVESLWLLYKKTNFIYPGKLRFFADKEEQVLNHITRLLSLNAECYQVVVTYDCMGKIKASAVIGIVSPSQCTVMHLACDRDIDALFETTQVVGDILAYSQVDWISYTFRLSNSSVSKMFLRPLNLLQDSVKIEAENYYYYVFDRAGTQALWNGLASGNVRTGLESDRMLMLSKLKNSSQWVALSSMGSIRDGLGWVGDRLCSAGLNRKRSIFATGAMNSPTAVAIADLMPSCWNFSSIFTGVRIWAEEEDQQDTIHILKEVAHWFLENGTEEWTMLLDSQNRVLQDQLNLLGFVANKQYFRFTYPTSLAPLIFEDHLRFIRRKK